MQAISYSQRFCLSICEPTCEDLPPFSSPAGGGRGNKAVSTRNVPALMATLGCFQVERSVWTVPTTPVVVIKKLIRMWKSCNWMVATPYLPSISWLRILSHILRMQNPTPYRMDELLCEVY